MSNPQLRVGDTEFPMSAAGVAAAKAFAAKTATPYEEGAGVAWWHSMRADEPELLEGDGRSKTASTVPEEGASMAIEFNAIHMFAFNDELEKLASFGGRRAKKDFVRAREGGVGAVKNSYMRARDMYQGYPKPGNKSYFRRFHSLAEHAGYPVNKWQQSEPEMKAGLLGIRPGRKKLAEEKSPLKSPALMGGLGGLTGAGLGGSRGAWRGVEALHREVVEGRHRWGRQGDKMLWAAIRRGAGKGALAGTGLGIAGAIAARAAKKRAKG